MTTDTNLKLKSKLYYYAAHVTKVYDGDTITVDLDLGLGMWRHGQSIRLWKVDTPELRGVEREEGLRVRDFVSDLLLGKDILVRTILNKRGQDRTGKYGRLLGEILIEDESGEIINVNELLIEQGMAVSMDADGSRSRSIDLPTHASLPEPYDCPYCGEERQINEEMGLVEKCPNCLDPEFDL